ncbi:MAG: type II/IV secretion system protein [Burkholderiales bacterium]|nr:type II/IV secretion system protein [Burkholderiales bacterium]
MNAPEKQLAEEQPHPKGRLSLSWVVKHLVHDGLMDRKIAERVLSVKSRDTQIHPLALLADMNLRTPTGAREVLDIERLTHWLADKCGLPYQHIDPLRVDFARVVDLFSSSYATSHAILPLAIHGADVVVATSEPFADDWQAEIERLTRKGVKRVLANPLDVARFTVEFYKLAQSIKGANKSASTASSVVSNFESLVELGGKVDAENAHVVTIVDWLLQYAFDQRASDIHLEPKREQGVVRFRIDGVLHQVYQVPPGVLNAMISRIKLLGRMDVVEKRRPLDGRIKTKVNSGMLAGREVEIRLSTLPTAFGEKLVARVFDPEVVVRGYGELGFSENEERTWKQLIARPSGVILVTGPTGSGKTTTLYSTLKVLATDEVNVSTVEDPIENIDPSLNQMQVNPGIDLGFADGLRALMRQDPDVIMVGEIRDKVTADMAVNAALTGHLVFSTLHTNDAASSIARLTELGVPHYMVNATLIGVLAQRLVRILCPHCKKPTDPPDEALWAELVAPWRSPVPKQMFKPVGCLECRRTGYLGRTGLIEMLVMTDAMRALIAQGSDIARLRNQAARDGLRSLRVSGAEKIANGITTLDEVLRAAPPFMH